MIPALDVMYPLTGYTERRTYPTLRDRLYEVILLAPQPVILRLVDIPEVEQIIEEAQRVRRGWELL